MMEPEVMAFDETLDKIADYLNIIEEFPPRGDGTKDEVVREWKKVIKQAKKQLDEIEKKQIEKLYKE